MNISPAFARNAIIVMWLTSVGIVVYKEFNNANNPGRPLPRPCKLIPGAIGYTGLGLMAEVAAPVAFMVALGLTIAEIITDAGVYGGASTILDQLASSIGSETQSVRSKP